MNLSRAITIQGWMQVECLEYLATQASTRTSICEIGSWMGRSTRAIADNTQGNVYAVDTWEGDHNCSAYQDAGDWVFDEFLRNMSGLTNVTPLRMTSLEAAAVDNAFDMIFIDASHDYDNVKADILAWLPKLTQGGLLCGHDYHLGGGEGVIKAVDELLDAKVVSGTNIWYKI